MTLGTWHGCIAIDLALLEAAPGIFMSYNSRLQSSSKLRLAILASPALHVLPWLGLASAARASFSTDGFLLAATSLPGDGWRQQHDELKWRLFGDMRDRLCEAWTT